MKKRLLFTSVVLFMLWVIGFFVLGLAATIHTILWVSVLVLLRSLMVCDTGNTAVEKREVL